MTVVIPQTVTVFPSAGARAGVARQQRDILQPAFEGAARSARPRYGFCGVPGQPCGNLLPAMVTQSASIHGALSNDSEGGVFEQRYLNQQDPSQSEESTEHAPTAYGMQHAGDARKSDATHPSQPFGTLLLAMLLVVYIATHR